MPHGHEKLVLQLKLLIKNGSDLSDYITSNDAMLNGVWQTLIMNHRNARQTY